MPEQIKLFINENWLSIMALIISFISLFLSIKDHFLSIPRLTFYTAKDFSRYIGFIWRGEPFNLAVTKIFLSNPSSQATNIESIVLKYKRRTYRADTCKIHDHRNPNGITILYKNNPDFQTNLNISSENILNNRRIEAYGTSVGFVVFYDFPKITQKITCKITLNLPNGKHSTKRIPLYPLKRNQTVINPLNKE